MQKHELADLLEPAAQELGYEIVRILTMGQVNQTLQIMIDRIDGKGITVDDCAKVSRKVSAVLDETTAFANKYTLEVSSPGIDRPLTKFAHFQRVVGEPIKLETIEAVEGKKRFKGTLVSANAPEKIIIDMDGTNFEICFDNIDKAKLV